MDFLQKLDYLLKQRNLKRPDFAEQAGIKYSSLMNWYDRGYENMSITSLHKVCSYFNVTMDSMIRDELDPTPPVVSESRPIAFPALEELARDNGMEIVYGFNYQEQPDPPFGKNDIFLRYSDGSMIPITPGMLDDFNTGLAFYLQAEAQNLRKRYEESLD